MEREHTDDQMLNVVLTALAILIFLLVQLLKGGDCLQL